MAYTAAKLAIAILLGLLSLLLAYISGARHGARDLAKAVRYPALLSILTMLACIMAMV